MFFLNICLIRCTKPDNIEISPCLTLETLNVGAYMSVIKLRGNIVQQSYRLKNYKTRREDEIQEVVLKNQGRMKDE